MEELLEKVKDKCSDEFYGIPYSFLTDEQKASISDLIAYSLAKEFATSILKDIITNH